MSTLPIYKTKRTWVKNCKVLKNGCWKWQRAATPGGKDGKYKHGVISVNGIMYGAARFAYELFYGLLSKKCRIKHSCSYSLCANPKHVIPGAVVYRTKTGWKKNCTVTSDGCWEWNHKKGTTSDHGKKTLRCFISDGKGSVDYAQRFAYKLFKSEIPQGHNVTNRCGNSTCVKPGHLIATTNSERMEIWWKSLDTKTRETKIALLRDRAKINNLAMKSFFKVKKNRRSWNRTLKRIRNKYVA